MVVTTTAIAFILFSFGLTFCGLFLYRAFKKKQDLQPGDKTGLLLSIFIFVTAFQNGFLGFGTLFFASDPDKLYFVLIGVQIAMSLHALFGVYTVCYIFTPQLSPVPIILAVGVLGIATVLMTILENPQSITTSHNTIEWEMSFPLSLITFYMLLVSIGSFFYIFFRLFLQTKILEIKIFSFVFSLLAIGGIVINFIRFVLFYQSLGVRQYFLDLGMGIIGVVIIFMVIALPIMRQMRKKI